MGSTYCEIVEKFDFWSDDTSELISGHAVCTQGADIHQDEVWNALTQSNSTATMAQELQQFLFRAFSLTTKRLLIDQIIRWYISWNNTYRGDLKKPELFQPQM